MYNPQTGNNDIIEDVVEVALVDEMSYDQGQPRKHHAFYFDSGDIVFQAEKAIFRVHRFFLIQQSKVLGDMFEIGSSESNEEEIKDGTIDSPLVLQDKARGWELILSAFYRREPLVPFEYTGQDMQAVLEIAHKYCMDGFEERILSKVQAATTTTQDYIDMLLASRVVESYSLYQKAIEGLVKTSPKPNVEQAKMIGVEAYFEIASRSGIR